MIARTLYIFLTAVLFAIPAAAQPSKLMPPALVQVAKITKGKIKPQAVFAGTVMYPEVAEVASESEGKVESVGFEEGQRVSKDEVLVTLNADLLKKTLQSTTATYRQVVAELEKAKIDYKRIHNLFKQEIVAEQMDDDALYKVKELENRAASVAAQVERIKLELKKTVVRAPFDGVVLRRDVDRGEWISPGKPVASVARDDYVEVVVDVPQNVIAELSVGIKAQVKSAGYQFNGEVSAIIPKGDIATRTFPVKIRIENAGFLIEGMEAEVLLPSGHSVETFLVPRDAVIRLRGQDVIFVVADSRADMVPVRVTGYDGLRAGISADGLHEGMPVVTKGNERLRQGQPVTLAEPQKQG